MNRTRRQGHRGVLLMGVAAVAAIGSGACDARSTGDREAAPPSASTTAGSGAPTIDSAAPLGDSTWRIATGGGQGVIGPATSRADLAARFGAAAATDTAVHLGEGETAPGTMLFAGDPARQAAVVWYDEAMTRPRRVQVSGDTSRWSVAPGISLGTPLGELERRNGRAFPMTGFGWDYGGTVMGWDQGALEQPLLGGNGRVIVRLAPRTPSGPDAAAVQGDGVFRSDHPAFAGLDPRVSEIIVEYDAPARAPSHRP